MSGEVEERRGCDEENKVAPEVWTTFKFIRQNVKSINLPSCLVNKLFLQLTHIRYKFEKK